MLSALQKFKKIFTDVIVWICAALCLGILLLNFYNVIARYVLGGAFIYTEDVTVISMLWIMGLGVSVGWMNREHLLINLIDRIASQKVLEILMFVLDILGIGVGVGMFYLGRTTQAINKGLTQSAIGFDESFRYWPVVVGGILLVVAAAECVAEQILKWKEGGNKK